MVSSPIVTSPTIIGVTSVGLVANTNEPVPVSSLITPANWADVVEAKTLKLFVV